MDKNDIFNIMNNHPIFHLATCDGNKPKVRHMMLYNADENGIFFHTSFQKDVCQQLLDNNNVELCFLNLKDFTQIRVSGKAIISHNATLKQEILNNPSRNYLKILKKIIDEKEFYDNFIVFSLIQAKAHYWNIQMNYNEMQKYTKEYIELN